MDARSASPPRATRVPWRDGYDAGMRQRAVRRVGAALLVAVTGVMTLGAASILTVSGAVPAGAQADPEVSRLSDDLLAVRRDLEAANARLMANREQQAVLRGKVNEVAGEITGVRDQIATTEAVIASLVAQRAAILEVVRGRAARLYVERQPTAPFMALVQSAPMEFARRRAIGEALAQRDEAARSALKDATDKLGSARDDLTRQRDALTAREAELGAQQQALADLDRQIQTQQADLDARAKDIAGRLQAAIAAAALRGGAPSVLGPPLLTATQLAGWWRAQRYPAPSVSVSMDELAQIYIDEGNAEGVRGDVAFAQAVLETGGFRYTAPGNNFAGMGWCDSCAQGRSFPTPRDGVRAQIQHLKNYADRTSRASGLAHPASVYWYAPNSLDQGVANENFDRFFAKGWAPTWNEMGNGNWATDPGYSQKVNKLYASMVAFAQ